MKPVTLDQGEWLGILIAVRLTQKAKPDLKDGLDIIVKKILEQLGTCPFCDAGIKH